MTALRSPIAGMSPAERQTFSWLAIACFLGAYLVASLLAGCASDPGSETLQTPYGTVSRRGPWVPNPAPVTNVYNVAPCDAGGGS